MSDEIKNDGRADAGKFGKGNKAALGNRFHKKVQDLRNLLIEDATPEKVLKVANTLIAKAEKGDVNAAREYFDRLFGKAKQHTELSGVDGEPIRLQQSLDLSIYTEEELHTLRKLYAKAENVSSGENQPSGD